MHTDYEVIVIGGGMSGLTAAITLADRGKQVALLSKGDPVCCLSTGCIDVLSAEKKPLQAIAGLPYRHPYHLVTRETILAALQQFKQNVNQSGLPYSGDPERNRTILTAIGTDRTTCLVPETMEQAACDTENTIHVVSFKRLLDFYPSYISAGRPGTAVSTYEDGATSTLGLATQFNSRNFREKFLAWLQGRPITQDKVAFPAVLGSISPGKVAAEIEALVKRPVFEIPTLPPSIPGQRLFRALKQSARRKGVHLYWGATVAEIKQGATRVEALALSNGARKTWLQVEAVILATGSFVSGGLSLSRTSVEEDVFHLPTYLPGKRDNWFNEDFFERGHPLEKAGIEVDSSFRPLGSSLENIFVCGSILAYSETNKYQCGHGLAIITGFAAAASCAGTL